jgi:hypothetical protein
MQVLSSDWRRTRIARQEVRRALQRHGMDIIGVRHPGITLEDSHLHAN